MTHPILQDMAWRYTTKRYDKTKKVSQEDMDVLLEALRLSASSINSQPWKFIVLESDPAKERMARALGENFQFNLPAVADSSHVILFAHNTGYQREDYAEVVDNGVEDGRTEADKREEAFAPFVFAEMNTDESGDTGIWTRAQLYIALGNALHALARLKIDSTAMEGIDADLVGKEFADELGGYRCDLALAIGYRDTQEDYNARLPKSRRRPESVFVKL
ncbi:MAG: nitroreductase family protein [Candidatus Thiodiazotropha sp.]|jgi:nitroreductase / dihydropteridine reductase